MKRYFVTGTDTDCGKTYVTSSLVNYYPQAAAIKPVASGCVQFENHLVSTDAQQLQQSCGLSLDVINPWRFQLPVSPHIAAKNEGKSLSARELADYCMNLQLEHVEHLFIEGAGGLMVPLNDHETWIDFLKLTELPIILVVGMKLGCINHALLTESVMKSHGLHCAGWIANCIDPEMLALEDNIETLKQKLDAPCLATIPFGGDISHLT